MDLLYNIEDFSDSKKISYKNLSLIEKAILDDDINLIIILLDKGETNYRDDILCNGYYVKTFKAHPVKCHGFVCFRSLTYLSLWKNLYYYSKIFGLIVDIVNNEIHVESDNLKQIYEVVINTNCCEVLTYSHFYDHSSVNYKKIFDVLSGNLPQLIEFLEKMYSEDKYELTNTEDVLLIECYKNSFFKKNDYKLSTLVGKLKYYWNKYLSSNTIVKLLFSQQAYEYYKYILLNKVYQLEQTFEEIVSNPYVDVNHICFKDGKYDNIYSLTTTQPTKNEMISKLKSHDAKLPETVTIIDVISNCHIQMTKEIIKNSGPEFLGSMENLLRLVLTADNMMSTDKIEIFEILMLKNLFDNLGGLVQLCLYDIRSHGLIEKLSEKRHLILKATMNDVLLAIKLLKHKELDILLSQQQKLVDEKYEGYQPLIHYFNFTKSDGIEEILTLKTLLKYKCDLDIFDSHGDTPLIHSIKCSRNDSFNLLFKAGADPFIYDSDGYNSFHRAIMNDNLTIVNYLKKCKDEKNNIINISTNHTKIHPIIFAINSNNPVFITQTLLAEDSFDCNYLYEGNSVLHYLIKTGINIKTKNILFKNCICKNFDLLEQCKIDMKPLVVKAVEFDLYEIVIMIMDKLLEKEEIKFEGYDNLKDINKILMDSVQRNVIVKNQTSANFYSLVMMYLKTNKPQHESKIIMNNFFENIFLMMIYTYIYTYYLMEYPDNEY